MPEFQETIAQATAVLGYDCIGGKEYVSEKYNRLLVEGALVGSTNPGDCEIEFWAGRNLIGRIKNSTGGANKVPVDTDFMTISGFIPANTVLSAKVSDAPAGNDIVLAIKLSPIKRRFPYRRPITGSWNGRPTYNRQYTNYRRY